MTEFRRNIGGNTWHWQTDCPEWPGLHCCIMLSVEKPENSCLCTICNSRKAGEGTEAS